MVQGKVPLREEAGYETEVVAHVALDLLNGRQILEPGRGIVGAPERLRSQQRLQPSDALGDLTAPSPFGLGQCDIGFHGLPLPFNAISLELGDAFAQFCISRLTARLAIGHDPSFVALRGTLWRLGPDILQDLTG